MGNGLMVEPGSVLLAVALFRLIDQRVFYHCTMIICYVLVRHEKSQKSWFRVYFTHLSTLSTTVKGNNFGLCIPLFVLQSVQL
jgi:hypothetical protein